LEALVPSGLDVLIIGLEQLIEGRGARLAGSIKRQGRGLCLREHQLHANWSRRVLAVEASTGLSFFSREDTYLFVRL
jgi:hypothetical protein